MFVALALAAMVCSAASAGYGVPAQDNSQKYPAQDNTYAGQDNTQTYGQPAYGGYGQYYRRSSESHDSSDSDSDSDSYNDSNERSCRRIRSYHPSGHVTNAPKQSKLERKGRSFTQLSCPSNGKPYALVLQKTGSTVTFTGVAPITDSVLLATGVNLQFVVKCNRRNTFAEAHNGNFYKVGRVSCVQIDTTPVGSF